VHFKEKPRILIVDDEPRVINLVREVLGATGFEVITAVNGESAVKLAALEQPDLVLLDIILPGSLDGYKVARRLREFSDVPIIMLTAKVSEVNLLQGFDAGADDYITKPFSSKELLARIRALLKRSQSGHKEPTPAEVVCGDVRIDIARRVVTVAEREIYLTPTEFNLLNALAAHPNQVMFHEQLLTTVWGPEYRSDVDYLRSYIHNIRKKIEVDSANPKIIVSSRGVGYMIQTNNEST
jgi:two-component system KDP operon response regulator KdpE